MTPPDSPSVELSQTVHDSKSGGGFSGGDRIWHKRYPCWFLPNEGDYVSLFDYEGETNDGLTNTVKQRWWQTDGSVLVELVPYQVDPVSMAQSLCDGRYRIAWWTEHDGDLEAMLQEGGWSHERHPRSTPPPQ